MAVEDAYHLLIDGEHTEENWKKAWPLLRKSTAIELLSPELESVNEESITLKVEITNHARQPLGLLHGGVSMLLAESAASMHSCWGLDLPQEYPVGIEINGSHIRSATEGYILVEAKLIRRSRTLVHHEVSIIEEKTNRLLSTIRVTNLLRHRRRGS